MNAVNFLNEHYSNDRETFKRSIVASIMDVFAHYSIMEHKEKQFAPLKKKIIHHLRMVENKTFIGISVHTLLDDIDNKSQKEILDAAACLKDLIEHNDQVARQTLGNAYTFFKTLIVNPYEYNTGIHSPLSGDAGKRMQSVSETAQSAD